MKKLLTFFGTAKPKRFTKNEVLMAMAVRTRKVEKRTAHPIKVMEGDEWINKVFY